MAPPRTPPPAKPAAKGAGLGRKLGPFPLWVWLVAGAVSVYVAYRVYRSNQQANAAATAPASTDTLDTSPADNGLAGSGVSTDGSGSGSGGGLGASDYETLFSAQQSELQDQEQLVAELAGGAQTLAQTSEQQLGSLAGSAVGALATLATNTPSPASTPTSPSTPARTPTPSTEPNPGAMGPGPSTPATPRPQASPAQIAAASTPAAHLALRENVSGSAKRPGPQL